MHTLVAILLIVRAAWIATVANIDWPAQESTAEYILPEIREQMQKSEMIMLLDSLQRLHFNAIIFQARPTADALYLSELEPRSKWTGSIEYDPLDFVVMEAHKRGMEVHAWLNPYRITLKDHPLYDPNRSNTTDARACDTPVYINHPEWLMFYGGQWFFDPGLDETRDWICDVVEDIVCRYAVDAIHMDDYFYPYPVAGKVLPDEGTYRAHPRDIDNIHDWRRNNVNMVIREISERIRATRPECRFGISPFGNNDKNYNELYADIELWLRNGWIDYVAPQLYWNIGHKTADYERLAHWWAEHCHGRDLYIGLADYRLGEKGAWSNGNEIMRQVRLNRTIPEIKGECFYSTRPLLRNPMHLCDSLIQCP